MSRYFVAITILMLFVSSLHASGDLKFTFAAPEGLLTLSSDITPQEDAPINTDQHGMEERCYKSNVYFVYSENFLGDGYIISRVKPKGLVCAETKVKEVKNSLGMFIGQSKQEIERVLGVGPFGDKQVIWWHSKTKIRDSIYDVQTHASLEFMDNKLEYLSVFTTITN